MPRALIALVVSVSICGLVACKSSHEHGTQLHEGDEGKEAAESEEGEEGEIFEMVQPATSLSAAIATAQQSVPDGRFLKAEIESEGGQTICSVILASGGGQREVKVDATNGKVLGTEDEKLEPECGYILEAIGKDPAHAPLGAEKAIEAALAKAPGAWALAAGLYTQGKGEVLYYAVCMIDGRTAKVAAVSAADGIVQKVRVAEMEEEEGEEGMEESKEREGKEEHEAPPAKPK